MKPVDFPSTTVSVLKSHRKAVSPTTISHWNFNFHQIPALWNRHRKEDKRVSRGSLSHHSNTDSDNTRQWQRDPSQDSDWNKYRSSGFDYGVRRDYSRRTAPALQSRKEHRPYARERLSFTKDNSSTSQRGTRSREPNTSSRSEWRPIGGGSTGGTSAQAVNLVVSHTPPPNPQREPLGISQAGTPGGRQRSGDGSAQSNERRSTLERIAVPEERSALKRLSFPSDRVPLLHEGMANAAYGRLQEVNIEYLEDTINLNKSGGSNVASSSKQHTTAEKDQRVQNGALDRSPIRSLSEDRIHVSLRLGPINDPEREELLEDQLPMLGEQGSGVTAPWVGLSAGKAMNSGTMSLSGVVA
ncbi:hypothetical protein DY000_02023958 [Brassica cretica]|uniref:DUF4005 domain-containing protein n=1 Tax=Brassica cretica TaxID=69181 RepID=A0ABQ7ELN8_BRACR|nr:hypothetical protein DY000_02023958 [Brassica cretica]